jgi:hypothetical protein
VLSTDSWSQDHVDSSSLHQPVLNTASHSRSVFADSIAAHARDSSIIPGHAPSDSAVQRALRSADYSYDRAKQPYNFTWLEWLKDWLMRRFIPTGYAKTTSTIIDIIIAASVIALVVLLAMWISKTNFRRLVVGAPKNMSIIEGEVSENIHEIPIEQLIRDAVARADYRRAVRYLFLRELKGLADANAISWHAAKTNSEYIQELQNVQQRSAFRALCQHFEAVWYGDHVPDAGVFSELKGVFDSFAAQRSATTLHRSGVEV